MLKEFVSKLDEKQAKIYQEMLQIKFPNGILPTDKVRRLEQIDSEILAAGGGAVRAPVSYGVNVNANIAANLALIDREPAGRHPLPPIRNLNRPPVNEPTCSDRCGDCCGECGTCILDFLCCRCSAADDDEELSYLGSLF